MLADHCGIKKNHHFLYYQWFSLSTLQHMQGAAHQMNPSEYLLWLKHYSSRCLMIHIYPVIWFDFVATEIMKIATK